MECVLGIFVLGLTICVVSPLFFNLCEGNVDPLYCPSVLLPIRSTAHPTYCNIRPTTAVYFCIILGLG